MNVDVIQQVTVVCSEYVLVLLLIRQNTEMFSKDLGKCQNLLID